MSSRLGTNDLALTNFACKILLCLQYLDREMDKIIVRGHKWLTGENCQAKVYEKTRAVHRQCTQLYSELDSGIKDSMPEKENNSVRKQNKMSNAL